MMVSLRECDPHTASGLRRGNASTVWSRAGVQIMLLTLGTVGWGCGSKSDHAASPPTQQTTDPTAASDRQHGRVGNETEAANSDLAAEETKPSGSVTAADDGDRPTRVAAPHPIDGLVEGQKYRAAIRALDAGEFATAERYRDELKDHPQFSVLADAIAGFALVKRGQPEEAIRIAEQISRVPVMQTEAYLLAGEAFHAQGMWADAIAAFRGALSTHADCLRAHRWLGATLYDTGAMRTAVEHFRTVADFDPDDFRTLRLAGLIHYDYQQYDEAIKDYRRLLSRPMPIEIEIAIRLELADSLRELRDYSAALEVLRDCPPGAEADVAALQAVCHESAGDEDEALKSANEAIEIEPLHRRGNLVIGRIRLGRRQWQDAIEPLQIVVEADPSAHEPRFLLGRALLQSGQQESGEAELQRSTELKELTLELAELHHRAIAEPDNAELRLQMGRLAEQLGRERSALSWYRAAQGLDPELAEAAAAVTRLASLAD